ncbi:hypothetical protein N7466_007075 [Penicillium verhagenii]|uniref:uncharacterized protein n=1 Tax=Penicillium verhagenii TaxID=1562060 RepID=UPI002545A14B|nr:uncharacterized protein N7466_007075 [Penicillium verhagenii]KAJ5928119.1 hypothetical protein N7466_007075 [Penicillium verhagenii]
MQTKRTALEYKIDVSMPNAEIFNLSAEHTIIEKSHSSVSVDQLMPVHCFDLIRGPVAFEV